MAGRFSFLPFARRARAGGRLGGGRVAGIDTRARPGAWTMWTVWTISFKALN